MMFDSQADPPLSNPTPPLSNPTSDGPAGEPAETPAEDPPGAEIAADRRSRIPAPRLDWLQKADFSETRRRSAALVLLAIAACASTAFLGYRIWRDAYAPEIAARQVAGDREAFRQAVNYAEAAGILTQTASSYFEWREVARRWTEALDRLDGISRRFEKIDLVRDRQALYARNRDYARAEAEKAARAFYEAAVRDGDAALAELGGSVRPVAGDRATAAVPETDALDRAIRTLEDAAGRLAAIPQDAEIYDRAAERWIAYSRQLGQLRRSHLTARYPYLQGYGYMRPCAAAETPPGWPAIDCLRVEEFAARDRAYTLLLNCQTARIQVAAGESGAARLWLSAADERAIARTLCEDYQTNPNASQYF